MMVKLITLCGCTKLTDVPFNVPYDLQIWRVALLVPVVFTTERIGHSEELYKAHPVREFEFVDWGSDGIPVMRERAP